MPDLIDYSAALALFEERHFGRAARRLGITQPALTARLRRMESSIGARLFDRSRRGVIPTSAGMAFVEGARRTIDAAEATLEAARAAHDGFGLVLRIGFTQIAACQIMASILSSFRGAHPTARLSLTEGTTASLERDLEQGSIDVAFVHPPLHAPGLTAKVLFSAELECRNLNEEGSNRPPIGVPRDKAPVLMGEVDRLWGRMALSTKPATVVDADTLIGSLVLSAAGYGPAIVVDNFPDCGFGFGSRNIEGQIPLETAVAWQKLDRRPALTGFLDHCLENSQLVNLQTQNQR